MKDDRWIVWLLIAGFGVCVAVMFFMLQIALVPIIGCVALIGFAGVTILHYVNETRIVLGDRTKAGTELPPYRRRADKDSGEPAYLAYPIRQLWQDLARIGGSAWEETRLAARAGFDRLDLGVVPVLVLLPALVAIVAGSVAGIMSAYLLIAVFLTLLLMVGGSVWLVAWSAVSAMESLVMVWRGIRQSCPYAGCYRAIALPAYDCAGCQQVHRRLLPNRFGLLRHDCRCGTSLTTTVLFGRHRGAAAAVCPHCDRRLPRRIGRVPIVAIPVVGGTAAGKSTLICLSVDSLRHTLDSAGARMTFGEQAQQSAFEAARAALRDGGSVLKTVQRMPDGLMVDIDSGGRSDRILYVFDPAGESYVDAAGVEAQGYLEHAEGLLIVVDPLALDGVARVLTPMEREQISHAVGGPQGMPEVGLPDVIVGRLLDALRSRSRLPRLRRIAVVVSKADALIDHAVGQDLRTGESVRSWLEQVGWGNNVRLLEQSATEVRYYRSGLDPGNSAGADPLLWLGQVRPATAAPVSMPPASAAVSGLPRGYRHGRKALYVMSIAAAVCAAVLVLVGGVVGGLNGGLIATRAVWGTVEQNRATDAPDLCDASVDPEC
ncbi:hypothetical protein ACFVMC_28490 [Nocardia sp. NPDC127579]|uniref:TRAFAC clade GTPase domain-containing protein n=1 Tax=Nocardia sp. NPDC127579 TaxID=3345402 RepID=UPI0036331908